MRKIDRGSASKVDRADYFWAIEQKDASGVFFVHVGDEDKIYKHPSTGVIYLRVGDGEYTPLGRRRGS